VRRNTIRSLILVLLVAVVAGWIGWPTNNEINLSPLGLSYRRDISIRQGLDLQGGIQVLLEAEAAPGQALTEDTMNAAKTVIERRVNALGVAEPVIQLAQNNRIIVELPGVKDPEAAIKTFGNTGLLEFIDAGNTPLAEGQLVNTSLGPAPTPGPNERPAPEQTFQTVVQGKDLASAEVGFDPTTARPEVIFSFKNEGATAFGDFTTKNVGRFLAITLDKRVLSAPVIQSPIIGGQGRITGSFTLDQVRNTVIQLKYGALPVPLKVVQNRTVGPTLGADSVRKSIVAGTIGLTLVAAFMILYYRVPGLVATLALLVYAAVSFAAFKLIPVVLTLAGIAGFILSIGMAVDANILIFERMREELRSGRSMAAALEAGFNRAWTSIVDANVATLITCVILFWFGATFGASVIQGFALTLGVGVLVSMFSAIFVTRTFLRAVQGLGGLPADGLLGLANRPRPRPSPTSAGA
jgi:preprotein translocase subunit SecD